MTSKSQIRFYAVTFCTTAIFVKYCYTTVGCYNSCADIGCSGCSPLGEISLWNGAIAPLTAMHGGHLANIHSCFIFAFSQNDENSGYLLNIMFIFGRCCHSLAVATPVKYEHDLKDLTYTFAALNLSLTDQWTNVAVVPPPPGCANSWEWWFVCL